MRPFASFHNVHQGETIIVCGCGESLNTLKHPERFITIGVNDVGRLFQPNYLVMLDYREKFKDNRFYYVETSQAEYLFTQRRELGVPHPNIVRFALGALGGTDFSNPDVLNYSYTSAYAALCLAVHMGASCIGLIGVDFTDNHFFGKTGRYPVHPAVEEHFRQLADALDAYGVQIFNLSQKSRLTAFPKMPIEEFTAQPTPLTREANAPLRIVSYSVGPVKGVPAILARCINGGTSHSARCLWGWNRYACGAGFQGDINWNKTPAEAETILAQADVVIVHNGATEPRHRPLLEGKAVITMAHTSMRHVAQTYVKQGYPGIVVGQYPATLEEFNDWTVVPNPVPLWEKRFRPAAKASEITICYTPMSKTDSYPRQDPLYWRSKEYTATRRILEKLAAQFPIRLAVIRDCHLPHTQVLEMKQRAHIVIDECATGNYHRNSLEGLAAGCVVVNGVGLLPDILEMVRYCAGGEARNPFVFASIDVLEGVLTSLIERGAESLVAEGQQGRKWMEQNWGFAWQWRQFWLPVINKALHTKRAKMRQLVSL